MGVKTWILVHSTGHPRALLQRAAAQGASALDETGTAALVAALFPEQRLGQPTDTTLAETSPPEGTVVAGRFPELGLDIVMSTELAIDHPSKLPARFIAPTGRTTLHASHSVVDWFAYAIWKDGVLQRALSLSPDSGVLENTGTPQAFEPPYWAGDHPAVDPEEAAEEGFDYPLPFHPLELSDTALRALLGFSLEGPIDPALPDPDRVRLLRFAPERTSAATTVAPPAIAAPKPWWRFW